MSEPFKCKADQSGAGDEWTGYELIRFGGDTVAAALSAATKAKEAK